MAAPSIIDLETPFDPTGYGSISGAQLEQLVAGATPYSDKGMIVVTTDSAGSPTVPNAATTTKWQRYLWIRISATSVGAYVWNPNGATDPTLLNWVSISVSTIGNGAIVDSMIATNTITYDKIVSITWSQITAVPSFLSSSTPAGGVLSGFYPNPSIGAGQILATMIANNTITNVQISNGTIGVAQMANDGVALDMMRVNAGANAMEWFSPPKIFTSGVVIPTGNALAVPQVNSGATDFQMKTVPQLLAQASVTFTSAQTALSPGSQIINSAHGLGAVPTQVIGYLVCQSTNAGYSAGMVVPCSAFMQGASSSSVETWVQNFIPYADNVNVYMTQNSTISNSLGIFVAHATTGVATAITAGDWKAMVVARL